LFVALAGLVVMTMLWAKFAGTMTQAALVGGGVGLLTPLAAWALYTVYVLVGSADLLGTLTWVLLSAAATMGQVCAVSVPIGVLLGAGIRHLEGQSGRP
jgi:hypothetical protein